MQENGNVTNSINTALFIYRQEDTFACILCDVGHACLLHLLEGKHGDWTTKSLYYGTLMVKSCLYYTDNQRMPFITMVCMLDLLARPNLRNGSPPSLHATYFKMLSSFYLMSCFFT